MLAFLERKRLEREGKDQQQPPKSSSATSTAPKTTTIVSAPPLSKVLKAPRKKPPPPPRSFDPLALLPVELILRILDLLPFASLVLCSGLTKSWRSFLRRHRDLWRDLALVERQPGTLNNAAIKSLVARAGSQLRSLHVRPSGSRGAGSKGGGVTMAGLRDLGIAAARHTQFTALTIESLTKLNRDTLAALLVPSLKSVSVPGTGIDDEAVAAMLAKCPQLEHLNISNCKLVTGTGFSPSSAPSHDSSGGLVTLDIVGCASFSAQGIEYLTRHPRISSTLTQLFASNVAAISNWCLLQLTDLPALHTLHITHHTSFMSARLVQLLSTLRNLRSFQLPYCPAINDQVLQILALHSGSTLESLLICGAANVSGFVWTQCISQFTCLTDLHVAQCPGLSTGTLEALPTTLQSLDVRGIDSITDRGLDAISLSAPNLHTLHVGQTRVTTGGLKRVMALLPHLKVLDVSGCGHVSPAGLAELRALGQRRREGVAVVFAAEKQGAGRSVHVSGF